MALHCAKYKRYFINFSPSIVNIIFTHCNKLVINNVLPIFVAIQSILNITLICIIVIFPLKRMWHCSVHICTASIFIHEKQHFLSVRKEQTEKQIVKCNFLWRVIADVSPMEMLLIVFRYYLNTLPPTPHPPKNLLFIFLWRRCKILFCTVFMHTTEQSWELIWSVQNRWSDENPINGDKQYFSRSSKRLTI